MEFLNSIIETTINSFDFTLQNLWGDTVCCPKAEKRIIITLNHSCRIEGYLRKNKLKSIFAAFFVDKRE